MPRSNRAGRLSPDENELLRQYEVDEGILFADRPTLAENAPKLLELFAKSGCAWIRDGRPLVTVPGRHPEQRLVEARP